MDRTSKCDEQVDERSNAKADVRSDAQGDVLQVELAAQFMTHRKIITDRVRH
ncbi:hypothetical protein NSQ90_08270 [Paenibacillus sp. FSL H7-0737]